MVDSSANSNDLLMASMALPPRRWLAAASPLALLIAVGASAPALAQQESEPATQEQDADQSEDVERISA